MSYLLLLYGNTGYAKAPQFYVYTVIVFLIRNSSLDIQQTEECVHTKY